MANPKRLGAIGVMSILLAVIPYASAEDSVDFVTKIEMIKGHLHASLQNKAADNEELAAVHAGHPIGEVFTLIKSNIASKDQALADELEDRLSELPDKVGLSLDEYRDEVNSIIELLDQAVDKVVGEEAKDAEFLMKVIINLLEDAEHEYEEAVNAAGEIINIEEYQDAQGFIVRANDIFNKIKDSIKDNAREELELFFRQLDDAIENVAKIEELEKPIKGIIHEFEEILGIERTEIEKPTVAEIRLMLDAIVHEYEEGEYEEALEIATKAYLEKYEFLEADIAAVDEELMEETEIMLREELRQLIRERAGLDEIKAKVDAIKANLDKIEALGIGVGEDPRLQYVNNIEALLDKIVEEYSKGEYEEAEQLIIQAYLDNYEFIENDVKSYDEELNEEFEHLLTVELATKIKNRESIEEVQATVDMIKAKLDIIETQVVPEFPIGLIIALSSVMGIAIAATRFKL
ncbi:MAG: hypothetical protein KatS3mg003_0270 [Candidatus Nitrosocaldaceae archaeon]|nr:MAG: hypothetical protein KatS3mg003_0270 [Candidatus Nitrosocaldaceae archaeon]